MRSNFILIIFCFIILIILNIFGLFYLLRSSSSLNSLNSSSNSFNSYSKSLKSLRDTYTEIDTSTSTSTEIDTLTSNSVKNSFSSHSLSFSHSQSSKNNPKVGVIVRSHGGYKESLMSLLWGIVSQSYQENVRVIIVPTEEPSTKELLEYLNEHFSSTITKEKKSVDVILQDLPSNIYQTYCCVLKDICTDSWRNGKLNEGWSEISLNRYCEVNSPLHYHLTDIALSSIVNDCPSCRYLLVTNADNSYSPDFLSLATKKIEEENLDIVLSDMVHRGKSMEVSPELGKMDLGCALISLDFLRQTQLSFVKSLPFPAEPQNWHDADFWLIQRMIEKGAMVGIIRNILFVHN